MSKPWIERNRTKTLLQAAALAAACALTGAAWACGPWLDYDTWPHADQETSFLARMLEEEAKAKKLPEANDLRGEKATAETEKILAPLLPATEEGRRTLARWRAFRKAMCEAVDQESNRRERIAMKESFEAPKPPAVLAVPAGLPPAFALYEAGILAWHKENVEVAWERWRQVLVLPEDQRKCRDVNAAYMLGRSLIGTPAGQEEDACAKAFAQCRALAALGHPDPEGLAAASYGWEARDRLEAQDYKKAIALYFTQAATGDHGGLVSLNIAVAQLMRADDAILQRVAKDAAARRIVSAVLLNRRGMLGYGVWSYDPAASADQCGRWTTTLEAAGVAQAEDAAILAWFAYESGNYARAESLATGSASPMCAWIRAKMALRRGDETAACAELEKAIAGFDQDDTWAGASLDGSRHAVAADGVRVELAELRRKQGNFLVAIDLCVAGGANGQADELAERVLTLDELKAWVDRGSAEDPTRRKIKGRNLDQEVPIEQIWPDRAGFRWLLARRLARAGRWREARPYFPPAQQVKADEYLAAVAQAQNPATPKPAQAEAWWRAAEIARHDGMELLGTQLAPDNFYCDGNFGGWNNPTTPVSPPHSPSEEERRIAASAPSPDKRWHYRYLALDHAWKACELLDDNSAALELRLWTAGLWVAHHDPAAAEPFYCDLVDRCDDTAFGQDAAARRWFPPLKPGSVQPPYVVPSVRAVWRARFERHPWLWGCVSILAVGLVTAGVAAGWWWRKRADR